MEGYEAKQGDIKGEESPSKKGERDLFMKQEKDKVNSALFGVELERYT